MPNAKGEYLVGDKVYLIYNDVLIKAVVTAEINIVRKILDVQTTIDIKTLENQPYKFIELTQFDRQTLYNVSAINKNKDVVELTPIKAAFPADKLYADTATLFESMLKECE